MAFVTLAINVNNIWVSMSKLPSRKRSRQCFHFGGDSIMLNFQLSSAHKPMSCDMDSQHDTGCKGTQTTGLKNIHLDTDKRSRREAESELNQVKEQLRNADDHIAYLVDKMRMYRYKWLAEYYRAENLELHMPDGVEVPDLDQIREDIDSPGFTPELLGWDGEGSEGGEGIVESADVSQQENKGHT
ncbi:hypothetical protein BD769DRAFT_1390382 [Suillus cothurnatus]|nr:hypothetical protein BD769DRAFT_1390382 [Suillus cothurnatus]